MNSSSVHVGISPQNISIEKSRERNLQRFTLENILALLENMIPTYANEKVITEYNNYQSDLEILCDYITAGIIMRSKVSWDEFEERSSECFLNLDNHNKAKSHTCKIMTNDNTETSEPGERYCRTSKSFTQHCTSFTILKMKRNVLKF